MKVKIKGNFTLYEQKTVGFFTTSQLIYTVIGAAVGIGVYALVSSVVPVMFSTLLATVVFICIAALGFLKLGGIRAGEAVRRIFKLMIGKYKYKYITEADYVWEEKTGRNKHKE